MSDVSEVWCGSGPVLLRRAQDVAESDRQQLSQFCANPDDRDLGAHLALARQLGLAAPQPGWGRTAFLWEILATLGAHGLQRARTVEPHLDAVAILNEAGVPASHDATWGVYAAEGAGTRLVAQRARDGWEISGVKPWCSLGTVVDRALVTAWVSDDQRTLFDVDLRAPGVRPTDQVWHARGLADVTSTGLCFDDVAARAIGAPGWYLARDGFAFGGMGVAAVWFGATVALHRLLVARSRRPADQLTSMHVGKAQIAIAGAHAVLLGAATDVDAGAASGREGHLVAARVRGVVADAVERVLTSAAHALGPGPLSQDAAFGALVADLGLYVRQHHAERDDAALGALVIERADAAS